MVSRRSKRPGRSRAGSRISGRLVAASTITFSVPVKPSISVRIWLRVCSRSSWPPTLNDPPRARPMASSSSMKMIAGALVLAVSNRSRTREAPDADDELDELRGRHEVERDVGLAGHGPGEQRLAGPGRPGQQHPLGDHGPEPPVAVGVAQEVDDLGHLVLDLVDPGHVREGGAPAGLRLVAAGPGAAKAAQRPARAPGGPPGQQDEQADQQQGGAEPEQHPLQQRRPRRRFGADLDVLLGQQLPQVVVGGELGPAGAEPGHLLLLVVHGHPDRVLELAVDGVLDPGDAGDVARLHLGAEQRVGHLGAFGGPDQQRRQHPVQHQQPQQQHPEPRPEQPRPLRPLAAVPPSALHPPRHPVATLGRRRSVRAFRTPGVGPAVPPVPLGVGHHRTSSSRAPRCSQPALLPGGRPRFP